MLDDLHGKTPDRAASKAWRHHPGCQACRNVAEHAPAGVAAEIRDEEAAEGKIRGLQRISLTGEDAAKLRQHQRRDLDRRRSLAMNAMGEHVERHGFAHVISLMKTLIITPAYLLEKRSDLMTVLFLELKVWPRPRHRARSASRRFSAITERASAPKSWPRRKSRS